MRHTTSTIEEDYHVQLLGEVGECEEVELIVGDACNRAGHHLVLFDYYSDFGTGIYTMEQTPVTAQRELRSWSWLSNYQALRRSEVGYMSIPTLSEWKQIIVTLILLSLVMGFMHKDNSQLALSSRSTLFRINVANLLAFNRRIYYSALKWVGIFTLLGLAGITIIFGHVSFFDIIGTLFCGPLVAYILHLVIIFFHSYEGIIE